MAVDKVRLVQEHRARVQAERVHIQEEVERLTNELARAEQRLHDLGKEDAEWETFEDAVRTGQGGTPR